MTNSKIKPNIHELQNKARGGNSEDQYQLGKLLIKGEQTQKNVEDGVKWLIEAAKSDNPNAILMLAEQALVGEGIPKDNKVAFEYYKKASQLNHPDANYKLGVFLIYHLVLHINEGEALIRKSANSGHADAQFELALVYLNGASGISIDNEEAIRWFEKSAESGNLRALNELGYLYAKGSDDNKIRPNKKEAIKYWTLSAEKGDAEAEYNLATMYAKEAVSLWESSSQKGVKKSTYMLNLVKNFEWY